MGKEGQERGNTFQSWYNVKFRTNHSNIKSTGGREGRGLVKKRKKGGGKNGRGTEH